VTRIRDNPSVSPCPPLSPFASNSHERPADLRNPALRTAECRKSQSSRTLSARISTCSLRGSTTPKTEGGGGGIGTKKRDWQNRRVDAKWKNRTPVARGRDEERTRRFHPKLRTPRLHNTSEGVRFPRPFHPHPSSRKVESELRSWCSKVFRRETRPRAYLYYSIKNNLDTCISLKYIYFC